MVSSKNMVSNKNKRKDPRNRRGANSNVGTLLGQSVWKCIGLVSSVIFLIYAYNYYSNTKSAGSYPYNDSYPLTTPVKKGGIQTYRIGIIADLDTDSKSLQQKHTWYSYFKKGHLSYDTSKRTVELSWDQGNPDKLTTTYSSKGRGLEVSDLVTFDGKLLTFCDRTGMVFEIVGGKVIPWLLLMDGDGRNHKGFKAEWATVKDEILYVGSIGKEWTTRTGELENHNPMFVKTINNKGVINHVNWVEEYKRLREVLGIYWPGYMIHESGMWSSVHRRWFFLPRRCSNETYDDVSDERRGCSVLITANEDLTDFTKLELPNSKITRGFSSFKFLPNSKDRVIVALRTEELEGKMSTFITVFTIDGEILLEDTYIADVKYEGFEFI